MITTFTKCPVNRGRDTLSVKRGLKRATFSSGRLRAVRSLEKVNFVDVLAAYGASTLGKHPATLPSFLASQIRAAGAAVRGDRLRRCKARLRGRPTVIRSLVRQLLPSEPTGRAPVQSSEAQASPLVDEARRTT